MVIGNTVYAPPEWARQAACTGADPEIFFPETGQHAGQALAICRDCPVRVLCLRYALGRPSWGVWGGFSERNRAAVRTQHNRGRPLEDIIAASDARYAAKQARGNLAAAA
jgi:WhiB family transcriptional regulator, redox-sensing transcriptional regulator